MANFVPSCSKALHVKGLVIGLFCLLVASCDLSQDFSQDFEEEKGSVVIVLPGSRARAVYLPEFITDNMSYTIVFDSPEYSFSIDHTREKTITCELEPGFWDITVKAHYGDGAETAAQDIKPNVEILAGQRTSVSFTMKAEAFILPDRVEGPDQSVTITTSDTPPLLSVTMKTSTAFSGIPGWEDHFSYQWYLEDEEGTPSDVDAPGSFSTSSPGSENLSCAVDNSAEGIFSYWLKISNNYTYAPPEGGDPTSGSAEKSFLVAEVIVNPPVINPTLAAITINWPAGYLPESVTDNMSYVLDFHKDGDSFSDDRSSEKTIDRELEPGLWDITVTAHYGDGAETTALGKQLQVEIREEETTPVTFTMNAEEFILPDRIEGPNQDTSITTSDAPPGLSVTMKTSTAFSGIPGWADHFSYQWYYEDEAGTSTNVGSSGSFSASSPGSENLNCAVINGAVGTFSYGVKISNNYTYAPPGGGTPTSGSAEKSFPVAEVIVNPPNPTFAAITINWPAGHLPGPVTDNMSYVLNFQTSGNSFSDDRTSEKTINRELEPGLWDITVTAHYGSGSETTALGKQLQVEIREGETTPVTLTMSAEGFILPDRVPGPNQDMSIIMNDAPPSLSVTMRASTAFSGIPGWTDRFSYQWYLKDGTGASTNVGSPGSFSASSPNLSCAVINSAVGTFSYGVKISNNYTYAPPGGGAPTSGSVEKSFPVAEVIVVNPTLAAITIEWPPGYLPESIIGDMRYVIDFYRASGGSFSIGPTPEKTITRELDPGDWDIVAIAHYGGGNEWAAFDKKTQVRIQAGTTNPITCTMNADEFLTPHINGNPIDKPMSVSDPAETLSVTMNTSTVFTGISGWTDNFSYQMYYTKNGSAGPRTDVGSPGSFSASSPGSEVLSWTVDPSALGVGTFYYYAEITNNYTPTPTSATGVATTSVYVGRVVINPPVIITAAAITIDWPAGHLPEPVIDNMRYILTFYKDGVSTSVTTQNKTITRELEPGDWNISAVAIYGTSTMAAVADEQPHVVVQAGMTTPVSFTMYADEFITPAQTSWDDNDIYIGTGNPAPTLSIEIDAASTELTSTILGWTDNFSYQRYYKDSGGTPTYIDSAAVLFLSSPNPLPLALPVNNTVAGTFSYYVDVINDYTYNSGGTTATGTAVNHIHVGDVTVVNGLVYAVGDTGPGGGTIFYVGTEFIVNDQPCHYLEAGPTLGLHPWSSNTDPTGATGDEIGTGWTNTETIISALNGKDLNSAAHIARAYNGGSLSDWFLPSLYELLELYDSGYFGTTEHSFWTSTESSGDTTMACRVRRSDGHLEVPQKTANTLTYVRPIRAF
jgi:nitrogen fixation protein FixH